MAALIGEACHGDWGEMGVDPCPDSNSARWTRQAHQCFVLVPIPRRVLSNTRRDNRYWNHDLRKVIRQYHPSGPCRCSCGAERHEEQRQQDA